MSACCEPMSGSGAPSNLRPPRPTAQPYYVDTTNGSLYWWNGTGWLRVAPDSLGIDYEIATRRVRLDNGAFTTLPVASGTDFGLVKVGAGLLIAPDGTLSTTPNATSVSFGISGANLVVTVNGASGSVPLAALAAALAPLLVGSLATTAFANAIFGVVDCQSNQQLNQRCGTTE